MSNVTHGDELPESTLGWFNELVGGSIGESITNTTSEMSTYLFRPNVSEPELLIPLDRPAVTASALKRFHDSRSRLNSTISSLSSVLARLRIPRFFGGEIQAVLPFGILDQLGDQLGEPQLFCSVVLGPKRRNRKPVLQLIRPDGKVVGFAKIGWSPLTNQLVANERDILLRIADNLPTGIEAPTVLHHETRSDPHEQVIVVTSAVHNGPFAHRRGPITADFVVDLARSAPGGTHSVNALPHLKEWGSNPTLRELIPKLLAKHSGDQTKLELGLWHGDLTPWNTSTTKKKMVIWDWEFAGLDRPIGFDLLHHLYESQRRKPTITTSKALETMTKRGVEQLTDRKSVV